MYETRAQGCVRCKVDLGRLEGVKVGMNEVGATSRDGNGKECSVLQPMMRAATDGGKVRKKQKHWEDV